MKAALIVMTIMGCDDSATQCHYIDTVETSWQTVALCDAQAEVHINRHQNSNYPVIVAVCESSSDRMTADLAKPAPAPEAMDQAVPTLPAAETAEAEKGITGRTLNFVRNAIPGTDTLKDAVAKPVHVVEDGYSWVVRRFSGN